MTTALTFLILALAAFAVYWFMARPMLAQQEQFRDFYKALDDVEATFGFKLRMVFKGFKQKLWAWFLIIVPIVVSALQMIGDIDQTLYVSFLPQKVQPLVPLFVTLIGIVNLQLRKYSTTRDGAPIPTDAPTMVMVTTVAGKPDVEMVVEPSPEPDKAVEVVQVKPISPTTGL
jgi:hypothetical protein